MTKPHERGPSPRVSVILTSYNQAVFLRQSIESVLNQTFEDFELILWDDCSTDDSWQIIESLSDPRIRSFRNDVNRRGIYGINRCFSEHARGEYLAVHHSDDAWVPDKLQRQVDYLDEHPEKGAVFTWVTVIDDDGATTDEQWFNLKGLTREVLLRQLFMGENHLNHPSLMIRKSCYDSVGPYRRTLAQTGDAEMWSRVLLQFDVKVIEDRLTLHRLARTQRNTSSYSPATVVRTANEWNVLRRNYLMMPQSVNIFDVFPELAPWRFAKEHNTKFLLAMVLVAIPPHAGSRSLGVEWLYDLVNDHETASFLETNYHFTYLDLIALTKDVDSFGFNETQRFDTMQRQFLEDRLRLETLVAEGAERYSATLEVLSVRERELLETIEKLDQRQHVLVNYELQLDTQGKTILDQERSLRELTETLDKRQHELKDLRELLADLSAKLHEKEVQLQDLTAQLDSKQKAYQDIEKRLDLRNHEFLEREGIIAELTAALDNRQRLLNEFESRLDTVGRALLVRDEELRQVTATLDTRQHELRDAVLKLDEAGHMIIDRDNALLDLSNKYTQLVQENSFLARDLDQERTVIKGLEVRIGNLEQVVQLKTREMDALTKRISELRLEVQDREELLLHANKVQKGEKRGHSFLLNKSR